MEIVLKGERLPESSLDAYVRTHGRVSPSQEGLKFPHTGSGFDFIVDGKNLTITLWSRHEEECKKAYVRIDVENNETIKESRTIALDNGFQRIEFNFDSIGPHTIRIRKRSEALMSKTALTGIETSGRLLELPPHEKGFLIEFIGDSTTCGYGNLGEFETPFSTEFEDGLNTYAVLASKRLGAEYMVTSYSGIGIYKSFYASTTMPKVYPYLDHDASEIYRNHRTVDLIVVNIGTNDNTYLGHLIEQSRLYEQNRFKEAYASFLKSLLKRHAGAEILSITQDGRQPHVQKPIQEVVEGMESPRVRHTSFSAIETKEGSGSQFHPSLLTHQKWAGELVKYIQENLGTRIEACTQR